MFKRDVLLGEENYEIADISPEIRNRIVRGFVLGNIAVQLMISRVRGAKTLWGEEAHMDDAASVNNVIPGAEDPETARNQGSDLTLDEMSTMLEKAHFGIYRVKFVLNRVNSQE
ncbi:hypothetical protein ACFQ4U_01825 [Micrococcus antarcticus]